MFVDNEYNGVTHDQVTTIVVAVGSDAEFLSGTLRAVAAQSTPPQRVIVAVTSAAAAGSLCDDTLIRERLSGRLIVAPVGTVENFGEAVKVALKRVRDEEQRRAVGASSWLWLLHADSVPEPDALTHLLDKAETSAKIGIVGSKQVAPRENPDEPVTLREAGIRATRTARRVPEIREGERDQGQYDAREDMLAVGTAGMLVRETAWDQLNGFNPHLGPFGDGLEFSRRMWLAGYRVVLAPQAAVAHGNTSLAPDGHLSHSYAQRRRAQIFNALVAAPAPVVWLMWLGYIAGAIPRAIVRLIWRDGERARGEIAAGFATIGMIGAIVKGRRAVAVLQGDRSVLHQLESSAKDVRQGKKNVRKAQDDEAQRITIDPLKQRAARDLRMHTRKGALVTALLSAVYGVLMQVPYMSAGIVAGGALATDSSTAVDLLHAAAHTWVFSGDGYAGSFDAYWLIFLPALGLGLPWGLTLGEVVTAGLYIAPLAAALSAYLAAGVVTKSWVLRTLAAGIWIVSPSLVEALQQGRSAALTVHILLPLAVFAVAQAWRNVRRSRVPHSPAGVHIGLASLIFAGLTLAAPLFAPAAVLTAVIGLIACAGGRKRWLWVPVPALAFLIEPAARLGVSWRAWLAYLLSSPGAPAPSTSDPRAALMGFASRQFDILSPNLDWALFVSVALLATAAAAALLRLKAAGVVRIAWLLIVVGLAVSIAGRYVPVSVLSTDGASVPVPAWHGVGYSIAWLGIVIAIAAGGNGLRSALRRISFGPLTIIAALCGLLVPMSVLCIASVWIAQEWTAQEHTLAADYPDKAESHVPAVGLAGQESDARSRVLVLNAASHGYVAQIWRSDGLQMHEYSAVDQAKQAAELFPISRRGISAHIKKATAFDSAEEDLAKAIANIFAAGEDVPAAMADHAISVVLILPAGDQTDTQTQAQLQAYLNAVPGLEYVTENATGTFWRVGQSYSPARLRIITPHHPAEIEELPSGAYSASAEITADSDVRYLVLAERASDGWKATLNGQALQRIDAENAAAKGLPQWANIWEVPSSQHGAIHVYHPEWLHLTVCAVQIILLLLAAVTALPLRPRREDVA